MQYTSSMVYDTMQYVYRVPFGVRRAEQRALERVMLPPLAQAAALAALGSCCSRLLWWPLSSHLGGEWEGSGRGGEERAI